MISKIFLPLLAVIATVTALTDVNFRVDCHPESIATQNNCEARGCIYDSSAPSGGSPYCYYPEEFGYEVHGNIQDTTLGFRIELLKTGPASFAPGEFADVIVDVEFQTESRLHVKIHPNEVRFEVPLEDRDPISVKPASTLYDLEIETTPVFSFKVIRKSTSEILFDSSLGGLTLADQFLQIAGRIPTGAKMYGLGEHEDSGLRHEMEWEVLKMFATDRPPRQDSALYGTHPYYTVVEDTVGNTHSVLIVNSNAQEMQLTPAPGVVYRTIGGVIDMYFFLGPTPEETTQQYTKFVGRQPTPAYWALGFHLCRWGYDSLANMQAAYDRTIAAGIPLEAQWADIDFMDRKLDFTYDPINFAGLPEFIDDLHDKDQRFVIIADPGVPTGEPVGSYPPFEDGSDREVWILDGVTGTPLLGSVWPENPVHFPDFSNMETHAWWTDSMKYWRDQISFDGLWIDMNEPSNFIEGSFHACDLTDTRNSPPYDLPELGILHRTICMDAQQAGGSHYDMHSLYGWWQARATQKTIQEITGERGFVLSRSTFVGSGAYAAHWLGDNYANWNNLRYSIIGILQFNQFGIPMVGADICGFTLSTTEELCLRWQQVGAFYPFSRNHNIQGAAPQDPAQWPSVAAATKSALETRYSLLPYLYTLFHHHSKHGSTVVRSLWQQFPSDLQAQEVSEQFLWGSGLLVSPVLYEGYTSLFAYFPASRWFDFYSGEEISATGEESVLLEAPLDGDIPLHVRGGETIVTQAPEMTTTATRQSNFELIVALDSNGSSSGELFWDDGISIELIESTFVQFNTLTTGAVTTLTSTVHESSYSNTPIISSLKFLGVDSTISKVSVNGDAGICQFTQSGTTLDVNCNIDTRIEFELEIQ